MSGTVTSFLGNPQTNNKKGFSLEGLSSTLFKNPIGLGVCVSVASPALCKAVISIPVAIPTDSFT